MRRSLRVALALALLIAASPALASIAQRSVYELGETVLITTTNESGRVLIEAPEARYRLLDQPGAHVPFVPKTVGEYRAYLVSPEGGILANETFRVIEPPAQNAGAYVLSIAPKEPHANDNVTITISPPPQRAVSIVINAPGGVFKYSGPWKDAPFIPRSAGPHEIILSEQGAITGRLSFDVLEPLPPQAPNESAAQPPSPANETRANASAPIPLQPGQTATVSDGTVPQGDLFGFSVKDGKGRERVARVRSVRAAGEGTFDVELEPEGKSVRKLRINGLRATQRMDIGIDDVNERGVRLRRGPALRAYAINLEGLDFANATATVVAEGTELYKCAAWNFTLEVCAGTWVKVQDLRPGQPYTLTLAPGDPGYAETGIATVNSKKPIYAPGEQAELLITVLDTSGFLVSSANVTLTITAPDNTTTVLRSDDAQITQIDRGVYFATTSSTALEGGYGLLVRATAPNVNSTMFSQFLVQASYPFDILRDTPTTTDPWKGPFRSEINVTPRIAVGEYSLTEVLPGEFNVVSAPGAQIAAQDSSTQLTWSNLSGNAHVEYSAQPPLATPALFAIGKAFVTYVEGGIARVFEEWRAWFLAIDPEVSRDQGLVIYGDRSPDGSVKFRNWTGSVLQGEQDSGLDVGDRTSWFRFRCSRQRYECLALASDGGNDLNFAVFDTNSWTWRNSTQLDSNIGQDDQMQFDVECEDTSGDCLIAFEDSTGADATFVIRSWNASGLQNAQTISISGGESNPIQWIELYPRKGTDQIGIALQNDGGGADTDTPAIYAAIWNGTNFTNWHTVTTNGPAQGNERTWHKHFDCAWDGSGRFTCAYGNNSVNGVLMNRWNGTAWSHLGNVYGATGEEVLEVALCGQEPWSSFSHSDIGVMFCDQGSDLDGGCWNGTNLSKTLTTQTPGANTNAECGVNKGLTEWARDFECRWEYSGDQAVFVWVAASNQDWLTSGTYTRSTSAFSMANWSTGAQVVADGAGNLRMAQLVPNQGSDDMFLVYADDSSDGGCADWTGVTWDGSGCNNQQVFETGGARAARQWLTFDWFRTPAPQPQIEILSPNGTTDIHTYGGIVAPSATSMAWDGATAELPPSAGNSPITGAEFPSAGYVNASSSDNARHSSTATGSPTGRRAYQSFNFSITESTLSMHEITITHEGYATETIAQGADQFYIYVYNWSSDAYVLMKTVFPSSVDVISTITITSDFNNYVRGRQMLVLVEGDFAIGTGANARADVLTDYIDVTVASLATLRANVTVNASAVDDDGVGLCEWAFFFTNGTRATNLTRMINTTGPHFWNASSTTIVADGTYNLTVLCNDTFQNRRNVSELVRIDNTKPIVALLIPGNASNFTASSVTFAWNATDLLFENMLCNLSINSTVSASDVVSPHAENVSRAIGGIADGPHSWSVTCVDAAGNANTSGLRAFDVDTAGPTLTLGSPIDGAITNVATANFTFTATDAHAIMNCTLRIDGIINKTLSPVIGSSLNITVPSLYNGFHQWNVTCVDAFGFSTTTSTRNISVDTIKPSVYLNTSNGATFNNTLPQLNYTASDNMDANITCNISVNNAVVDANILTPNNTLVSRSIDLTDGTKFWNVTCADDAGNANSSITRSFTVVGGPFVELQRPFNYTIGNGSNITFIYYVEDGDGIRNCSLLIDGAANQTNASAVTNGANNTFAIANLVNGMHSWNVRCYDTSDTEGSGVDRLIVSDRSGIVVGLNAPTPGQVITTTPVLFNFTFNDTLSTNATCNLTVDGTASGVNANFTSYNNTLTTRSQTVTNGLHRWNVTCVDLGGNGNISATRNFTVNVTFPLNVTVVTDKKLYVRTETARINVTARNETSGLVSSNVTLDIIFTNNTYTDVPWWNTSWVRRKPIVINETNGTARANRPIMVNITGLLGSLSSCNELRIVNDDDLAERGYEILAGDDVSWCHIMFNGSVSAGATSEQNYHAYYNNTGVAAAIYQIDGPFAIFQDDFEDGDLAGWTAGAGWDSDNGNPLASSHAHIDGSITNITMRPSSVFNLAAMDYDEVNVSFVWQINANWDAGEYLRLDFTNNSETSWAADIDSLDGTVDTSSQAVARQVNSTYRTSGFNFRFRATTNNANEDGGFDNVNLIGSYSIQTLVSAGEGEAQWWIERNASQTNITGNITIVFNTTGRLEGNYSAVVRATTPNANNRPGSGYDWFRIQADTFGPVISLTEPLNATTNRTGVIVFRYGASDSPSFVANCTLSIDGAANQTNASAINESGSNSFTAGMSEESHTWNVNCYDKVGNLGSSDTYVLSLDNTPPSVSLRSPNGTSLSSSSVQLNFTATDNLDTSILCNVSIDNGINSTLLNATSAANTSVTIGGVSEGFHRWNVTCFDNINNNATSQMLNFSVDFSPIVWLYSPIDGYGVNATNLTLFFNVSDTNLVNCTLRLNGAENATKSAAQLPFLGNNGSNNFTLANLSYGPHNWTVVCNDASGFAGTDTVRTFYLDFDVPNVTLGTPSAAQALYTSRVEFNFTATDAVDPLLACNLSIKNVVNKTGINATNGAAALVNVTGFIVGAYNWSVTCVDNAGFVASSSVRNFTIVAIVNVLLNAPANNSVDGSGTVNFTYTPQSIAGFATGFCDLYLDNAVNDTQISPGADQTSTFTAIGIGQGTHKWYVNCTDSGGNNNKSNTLTFIEDSSDPVVTANSPSGTAYSVASVTFNWTATDNLDTNLSCNVTVNGTVQTPTNIASQNGTATTATYGGYTDGLFLWNATCLDDAARRGTSATRNFTIAEPARIVLNAPPNNNQTRNQSQNFNWTATDNSGFLANCTVVLDGAANATNRTPVTNGTAANITIAGLGEGIHPWTVNCTDPSGNVGTNATGRNITIDLSPPNISLITPVVAQAFNTNNITFNWTATDRFSTTMACNVSVTNGSEFLSSSSVSQANGTYWTATIQELAEGEHNWSVTCIDIVGNANTSAARTLFINQPDLQLNSSKMNVNNTNPALGETILLRANVTNIGGIPASNAVVSFWDGVPGVGTFIGNSTASVAVNGSVTFNVSWSVTAGHHTIWAIADPGNAIGELNETNNNGSLAISAIVVNITLPPNSTYTSDTTPRIDFNLTDFTSANLTYRIFVGGSANGQSANVTSGINTSIDLLALADGSRQVLVQATDALGRSRNSSALTLRIDTTAPLASFVTANASWFAAPNVTIRFNITDAFSTAIAYAVYLDGTFNRSNATTNGTQANETLDGLGEGSHTAVVETVDELGNRGNSTTLTLYVDATAPAPNITTQNNTWFNTSSPNMTFAITDNLDTLINWALYVNGAVNATGMAQNGTNASGLLAGLGEGTFTVMLQATDDALNARNSSQIAIFVDHTAPNVTLHSPPNATNFSTTAVTLNFTASDNMASALVCNLTLDGQVVAQYNLTNGADATHTASSLAGGAHTWAATCLDNAMSRGTSETRTFFINLPDLVITAGNITFSNVTPIENQTIQVSANVYNIGNINHTGNFTVQFWRADPDAGGVQIGGSVVLANLNIGENKTVTINYTTTVGTNSVYVVVDPPFLTNGSILETNETNNKASNGVLVGLFQVFAGGSVSQLKITDSSIVAAFAWDVTDKNASNVFVADTQSAIAFTSLQAIGHNATNGTATGANDFEEIDARLNTSTLNDSVNRTFTSAGTPKTTLDITSFKRPISGIPGTNSTNTSSFKTGILWDMADGGGFYNGSQDVVFVTVMNQSQVGRYGTYDYEIAVPATLRDYVAGGATITFYTELR
jgi:hypothetical protein